MTIMAQPKTKVYVEQENGINKLYADNDELCPVTAVLSYELKNMKGEINTDKPIILPAKTKKIELDKITIIDPKKKSMFSYNSKTYLGNITQNTYDKDFKYELPFKKSEKYFIFQGYNGSFSHQGQNALDFVMPVGTEILAIRDGIVIQIVNKNSMGCKEESCKQYNNYITIYHSDGTFAEYTHIKKNGNKVNIGDEVKQGDIIGLSGNTGWSSGPHLHLIVYLPTEKKRNTLSTLFKTDDGSQTQVLKENTNYIRNY
jgi:murein DD-endopeptidase MepM/ murein hydrolase activator NlpD